MAMHHHYAETKVSNNTLLVIECDGPVDAARVGRALGRLMESCPWPASRLRRGFPWGGLHWVVGARAGLEPPPVRQVTVTSAAALHDELEAELNRAIDPWREAPFRCLILDGGGRAFLVLTWFHALMDPRGGQNLLRRLVDLDREGEGGSPSDVTPALAAAGDQRSLRERARLGRRSLDHLRALTEVPPVSPGTSLTAFGKARFWQGAFVAGDTLPGDTRATRDICWRLAVAGRAMSVFWEKRGLPDVPFLVPISVDLRPKGEAGATIGNWLAFHFARFAPSETADVAGLARSLRLQMADAVRDGRIDGSAAGMEFLRYRPLWMMARALPRGPSGETFSFNCADTGDFLPEITSVFGRRVVNAYHAPAVLPRPGIGVFFNRCAARNDLVISWVEGTMSEDDVAHVAEIVREGMGWVEAP
ncbi:MAG TPA: hypothetical protein VMS64_22885 [Candidatus Methylomirabilis sp.]|nr:hypothetical protein [Candidatus Methylomirabilis sp.]